MSNLTIPLGIDSLEIISQTVNTQGNIIIDVETVCTNMYDGFVKAASEVFGSKVIDRYHSLSHFFNVCSSISRDTKLLHNRHIKSERAGF